MTSDEYIKSLDKKIADIVKVNKPLFISVKSVMALQSKRIFLEAKNKNGSNIGEYKDREYYINPKDSPKGFTPKGKYGDSKFKNGKPHKTGYFVDFLDYKKKIDRNKRTGSVDLFLSGELQRNWSNGKISNPSAIKINQNEYQVRLSKFNYDKVERYGVSNVFGLSKSEYDMFNLVLNTELYKALK